MLDLGLIAFTQPWILALLLTLPAIWLLLRVTPPSPRRQIFPALRLLLRIDESEETPARTPWWLLLLRMAIAALIILACSGPIINPERTIAGNGPILVVVDDDWASAIDWDQRQTRLGAIFAQAERSGREILLLRTSPDEAGIRIEPLDAVRAGELLAGWEPRPWAADHEAALATVQSFEFADPPAVLWLSSGISHDDRSRAALGEFAQWLDGLGPMTVYAPSPAARAMLLRMPEDFEEGLSVIVERPFEAGTPERPLVAIGENGEVLASAVAAFAEDETRAEARFDLPLDLRNRIARIQIENPQGVGEVVLLDERWRRRTAGLVGPRDEAFDQPLISDSYFVRKALDPYAEIRSGSVRELLDGPLSMMVMTDDGHIADEDRPGLATWIEEGGVLLRFAGPRLAQNSEDTLLPVPIRAGDRQLGGALSWSQPLPIASFNEDGPFAGLDPNFEATVSRQVLAEAGPHLREATMAALEDGTPLVTATRRGSGWVVLFHTTANTSWTSLPLSGTFVSMLQRILAMAPGAGQARTGLLEAKTVLDAGGRLVDAPPHLATVEADGFAELLPGPLTPPGLYGSARRLGEQAREEGRLALNLEEGLDEIRVLAGETYLDTPQALTTAREADLTPWFFLTALILALVDALVSLQLRGLLPMPATRAATASLAGGLIMSAGLAGPALANDEAAENVRAMEAALESRLAYVMTGDSEVDRMSLAGLEGLRSILTARTSIETGEPAPIDPAVDDLAGYPLLYWPVTASHPDLDSGTLDQVAEYTRQGGVILFDTKDAGSLFPGQFGGGAGEARLAEMLEGFEVPPLAQVDPDHVLTRSFYLMQEFPGRFTGQPVWVDQVPAAINDGVSSIIIGSHDWAGAWAIDRYGNPLLPVVPGGETQREMARRFGVNLVMYAMTGNYKTDQVHIPALLERLGQ